MTTKSKIKPLTTTQILARLSRGPAQFSELAQTRKSTSDARVKARERCEALVAKGKALLIYIGRYPYYILNTEEAKRQAILQHIEESTRRNTETGCLVWTGLSVDDVRGPIIRQAAFGSGTILVRRWLYEHKTGKTLEGTKESIKMRPRCDLACVAPEHMVKKSRNQLLKGIPKPLHHRVALQKTMRERRGKRSDAVEIIRSSSKSNAELARELNMSHSNVWQIRTFRTFALGAQAPAGMFSGLMGGSAS